MTDQVLSLPTQPTAPAGEVPAAQRTAPDLPALPTEVLTMPAGEPVPVTCPSCGTTSPADLDAREAAAFCPSCDYPLFWAVERRAGGGLGEGAGLRRLPGTAGRAVLAQVRCPSCTEPNPPSHALCLRCGSPMSLAPVAEPEPEPERVYASVPSTPHWIWSWAGMALIATVLLAVFTGIVVLTA